MGRGVWGDLWHWDPRQVWHREAQTLWGWRMKVQHHLSLWYPQWQRREGDSGQQ